MNIHRDIEVSTADILDEFACRHPRKMDPVHVLANGWEANSMDSMTLVNGQNSVWTVWQYEHWLWQFKYVCYQQPSGVIYEHCEILYCDKEQ
jgi:hypothetical protein